MNNTRTQKNKATLEPSWTTHGAAVPALEIPLCEKNKQVGELIKTVIQHSQRLHSISRNKKSNNIYFKTDMNLHA